MQIKNPELLRYVRSELRPGRVWAIVGGVVVAIIGCALLAHHDAQSPNGGGVRPFDFWQEFHGVLFGVSALVLCFWVVIASAQAIVSERTQKSFDFWRLSRSSDNQLLVGKLFGPALTAWLQYLLVLPVLVVTASASGVKIRVAIVSWITVAVFATALSVVGLLSSARANDARRAQLVAFVVLAPIWPGWHLPILSPYSLFAAFSPMNAIFDLYGPHFVARTVVFNHRVPTLLCSLGLSSVIVFWGFVVLRRIMRKDTNQVSTLSRLQAVGVACTIVVFGIGSYVSAAAMQRMLSGYFLTRGVDDPMRLLSADWVWVVGATYLAVLSTLASADTLRRDFFRIVKSKALSRIAMPWMITILVATVAVAMHLLTGMNNFGETPVPWRTLWFSALTLAVYVLRDGFVLQWFTGSRMKLPLIKGSAVLAAYYLLAALVSFSGGFMRWGPMGGPPSWCVTGVLVVQLAAGVAVGRMIAVRYANRPILSSAESHPATLVSSS